VWLDRGELAKLVAPGYLYMFGVVALATNLGAYFFSDRIVLRMHRAREISPTEAPDLHAMLAELSTKAEIPKPRLFMLRRSSRTLSQLAMAAPARRPIRDAHISRLLGES